jgi:OOP family OmpA-OmpF porin
MCGEFSDTPRLENHTHGRQMKKLFLAAACSAAFVAAPALAQSYVGAGVGAAKTNTNETSYKLYGGFQFNPTWGMEVAYNDLGRYRGANIDSWSIAGTGTMPLGENWSLLGKLGATSNRPKFTGASNKTDLLLGVGIGYSMTKNLGVRLEYEDFGKLSKSSAGGDSSGSNLGLSVKYTF